MTRRRRQVSLGTYCMLIITALTIGMGAWVFPRLAGDIDDIRIDTAALIGAIVSTPQPGATPVAMAQIPEATHEPLPTPTLPPQSKTVTVTVGGQIWLDATLRKSGQQEDRNFYYDDIFTAITPYMNQSDVTMVTLESTVSQTGSFDTYLAPASILSSLKNAGVDVINLATERIFDYGMEGLANTRASAEQLGFSVTGAHRNADEQWLPLTFEVNGVKVAVLSYTYGFSNAGSGRGTREERAIAVNLAKAETIRDDVRTARNRGANLVLVNIHWGKQSNTRPNDDQARLVDEIIDCGLDAIIGTHPTTVHSMERRNVYCVDNVNRDVFIAYSLGDFLVNNRDSAQHIIGNLLTLQFTLDNGSQSVRLTDARYMPTWLMRWEAGQYHYRIIPAGTEIKPPEMTDTIYRNMRRAYEEIVRKLGDDAARHVAQ